MCEIDRKLRLCYRIHSNKHLCKLVLAGETTNFTQPASVNYNCENFPDRVWY